MFSFLLMHLFNQPVTWQQLSSLAHVDMVKLKFKPFIRIRKNEKKTVNVAEIGLSMSEIPDLLGFSHTIISERWKISNERQSSGPIDVRG